MPRHPEPHAEVRLPRVARQPVPRTKADIEEYYSIHLNYRSWCEHCVAGKARMVERLGVTVHMDSSGERPADATPEDRPCLGCRDGRGPRLGVGLNSPKQLGLSVVGDPIIKA